MMGTIRIQMVGTQVACVDGVKDTWREIGDWAKDQLTAQFGSIIAFEYYDLFEPDCPELPQVAQLPLILVEGELVINGSKVSIPVIRKKIEAMVACQHQ